MRCCARHGRRWAAGRSFWRASSWRETAWLRLHADRKPGALPAQVLDHATGYLAAAAALLALAGVALGERPRSVRLSLAQTAHWLASAGTRRTRGAA